jgi:hypothetical protein
MNLLFHLALVLTARIQEDPDGVEFFERRIRPVLVQRCYRCHSLEAEKVKGGLLLDSREGLVKGGHSGPASVAGRTPGWWRTFLARRLRNRQTPAIRGSRSEVIPLFLPSRGMRDRIPSSSSGE